MDNLENDKIIVTGSRGYLGKRVISKLIKNKIQFIALGRKKNRINCDLLNKKKTIKIINLYNPKLLIHCAANVPKKKDDYNDLIKNKQNLVMFKNVLASKVKQIIFISSISVYGDQSIGKEKIVKEKKVNLYGSYKIKCEKLCYKRKNKKILILRLPGLFGVNRKNGIIYRTIKKIKSKKKITFTESFPKWHALHVDDAAEAILFYAKKKIYKTKIINIGYDQKISLAKTIEKIFSMFNKNIKFKKYNNFYLELKNLHNTHGKLKNIFYHRLIELKKEIN